MIDSIILSIPFPPSINHYWKHRVIGRHASVYLSAEALKFRADIKHILDDENKTKFTDRVNVSITLHAPNKRKYDIDNRIKSVFDALTHAGLWGDDEQVDSLTVTRGIIIEDGLTIVDIKKIK
jgi:crossover junction endodeoxyribonuclease RusA